MEAPLFGTSLPGLLGGAVFTALLVWGCAADLRTRRIPNWLVAALAVTGFSFVLTQSVSPGFNFFRSATGLAIGLTLWLPFYALRWLGAGDVKFFAAASAWLGPMRTIEGALIAAFVGGGMAVVWMLRSYGVAETAAMTSLAVRSPKMVTNHPVDSKSRRAIPYGVALAIGAMTAAWFPDILTRMFHAAQ